MKNDERLELLRQKKAKMQSGEKLSMRGTVRNLGLGSPEAAQNMILLALEEQAYLLQEVLGPLKDSADRTATAMEKIAELLNDWIRYSSR